MPAMKRKSGEVSGGRSEREDPGKRSKTLSKTRSGEPPKKRGRKKMTSQSHQEADAERARRDPAFARELLVREVNEQQYMDSFAAIQRQHEQQQQQQSDLQYQHQQQFQLQQDYQQLQVPQMANFDADLYPSIASLGEVNGTPLSTTYFQPQSPLDLASYSSTWDASISFDQNFGSLGDMNSSIQLNDQTTYVNDSLVASSYGQFDPSSSSAEQAANTIGHGEAWMYQQGADGISTWDDLDLAQTPELDNTGYVDLGYSDLNTYQYPDPSMPQFW